MSHISCVQPATRRQDGQRTADFLRKPGRQPARRPGYRKHQRHNPADTHDIIPLTDPAAARRRPRSRATRSAAASRSAVRNGTPPPAATTNGSGATASVHAAGSDITSPPGTRKNTRSTSQVRRRCTNSNSRPDHG